jgi:hypothetical protein
MKQSAGASASCLKCVEIQETGADGGKAVYSTFSV